MKAEQTNQPKPWVSIGMTTRRRPDLLTKTLKAIQRQTVSDFEVIVCDNDTAGSARAIVEGLKDERFRYYVNEKDLGINASFNRGLAMAKGEYVVMVSDDDPIYPEMLEVLGELAKRYPGYGAYYGGCDVFQVDPDTAKFTLHRVGTNSCLAPLPYGSVRTFSGQAFPHAFFSGELEMYLFWSMGMVRRDIAQATGMPTTYDSAYLGDFAYTATVCSHSGCVIINQAVGCQTVHALNYGRKERGELKLALLGFIENMSTQFSKRPDWTELKPKVERFAGQWVVLHAVFLKQYFKHLKIDATDLKPLLREIFSIPFMRRLRRYYYAGDAFIRFQRFQANLRSYGLSRLRKVGSAK